jgi:hypothetical protein
MAVIVLLMHNALASYVILFRLAMGLEHVYVRKVAIALSIIQIAIPRLTDAGLAAQILIVAILIIVLPYWVHARIVHQTVIVITAWSVLMEFV